MEKFKELQNRIQSDYEEYVKELIKNNPTDIINRAYEIAHYNEIVDVVCDVCDENDCPFDEEVIDKALECKRNLLDIIYESWQGYNHPERYNFFCYEGIVEIIENAIITYGHC